MIPAAERRGAIVLRAGADLLFIPAGVAVEVAPMPRVTKLPAAPAELLGIALHEGEIVPVFAVGPARSAMVVCTYLGETIGITGGDVVYAGLVECAGDHGERVVFDGRTARLLDVAAIHARVRAGGWGGRLGG